MDFGHVTPPRYDRTRTHSLAATASLTYNRELTQRNYISPATTYLLSNKQTSTRSIFHGISYFPKPIESNTEINHGINILKKILQREISFWFRHRAHYHSSAVIVYPSRRLAKPDVGPPGAVRADSEAPMLRPPILFGESRCLVERDLSETNCVF